jgi:DNA-binding MarR family transcriptional regulator
MGKETPDGVHVCLVFVKALQAISKLIQADLQGTGLGESDFRVLEILLHKGAQPVNVIGPKVNLTPGSISVAVDRLHSRGLVSRVEDPGDRRVRIVDLTPAGRELIEPAPAVGRRCAQSGRPSRPSTARRFSWVPGRSPRRARSRVEATRAREIRRRDPHPHLASPRAMARRGMGRL